MPTNLIESPEVLIAGAGPVGLSMACELSRHGVPFRIVDASPGPTDQSRALGIQARTLEVFEKMGVVDAVLAKARKIHGVAAFSDGRRIAHVTFDLEGLETHYPYLLILQQSETERILVDRLRSYGVEVERDTKLATFQDDGSGVSGTLAGADGKTSGFRASWLIGSDGARSVVRKGLGIPFPGADYEESFLLADVRLAWDRPDDEMTVVLTPEGPLVGFPLPEESRWRLVHASNRPVEPDEAEPGRVVANLQSMLRENGWPGADVSDVGWTSAFKIHRRVVDHFRQGRCFVAGDAAHIHSPAGGQGMNTGIQDAHNLAWKLALVIKGDSPEALLDSYSAERRGVVAGVIQDTDLLTKAVTLRNPVAKAVRNRLMGLLGEFDFVARKVSKTVSELGIEYHQSPIVGEDRGGTFVSEMIESLAFRHGPKPGDRIHDISLESADERPGRLFDLLRGTRHVLLLFEGDEGIEEGRASAVLELVRAYEGQVEAFRIVRVDTPATQDPGGARLLVDPKGELHRHFGASPPCLYLIRPDGYLGYRAMPPDAGKLASYLGRIFRPRT